MTDPHPPRDPAGSIRRDEVVSLAEFQRRFGLGEHAIRQCRRLGLRMARLGNRKFVLGSDAMAFFERLAVEQQQAGGAEAQQ